MCIIQKKIVVIGRKTFMLCGSTRKNVASVKGYDDHKMSAGIYIVFFQLCLWKPKKKKSQHILVSFEYTDWPKHRHSLYQSYCYKNCTLQTV